MKRRKCFTTEGCETLEHVVQRGGRCPIRGNVRGQFGWAIWPTWRWSYLSQVGWTTWSLKATSDSNCSVISKSGILFFPILHAGKKIYSLPCIPATHTLIPDLSQRTVCGYRSQPAETLCLGWRQQVQGTAVGWVVPATASPSEGTPRQSRAEEQQFVPTATRPRSLLGVQSLDLLAKDWHLIKERTVCHFFTLDFLHQPALVSSVLSVSLPYKHHLRYLPSSSI